MDKAQIEIEKAKEYKDMLKLPPRKENWSAQENAEEKMDEHFTKAVSYFREVVILLKGIEIFRDGLIYRAMKTLKFLKRRNKVKVE